MTKLKPCPFCDGEAKVRKIDNDIEFGSWAVTCESEDCGILGRLEHTKEQAIEAWNTRAEPALNKVNR